MSIIDTFKAFFKAPKVDPTDNAAYKVFSDASDSYNAALDAIKPYANLADFEPYTEAYLDAHTTAFENLNVAFNTLTGAFTVLNPSGAPYSSVVDLYKCYYETYTTAATDYSNAADRVMRTALEGDVQALKNEIYIEILEAEAANESAAGAAKAKAEATALKAKTAEDATKYKVLELKAIVARTKAEAFLAKAKSAFEG
jgi:hypothetical protein